MPREPKAWFNKQTRWWSTDIAGRRHKLVPGKPGDERRKTPTKQATDALVVLLDQCAINPSPEAGPAVPTVPSVIDEYLSIACGGNEERTFKEKKALLVVRPWDRTTSGLSIWYARQELGARAEVKGIISGKGDGEALAGPLADVVRGDPAGVDAA